MLTFSAAALQQMQSQANCRVAISLVRAGGTDLTSRISSLGNVQSSIRPTARDSEIGVLAPVMRNDDGYFSYLKSGSGFYGSSFLGDPMQLMAGVYLPNGNREVYPVFTGHLGSIEVQAESLTATLKCNNVMEKLRAPGVGSLVEKTLAADGVTAYEDAPAALAYRIIAGGTFAAIPPQYIDSTSFIVAARRERAARLIARGFKFKDGSWYDNLRTILDHSSAGLRINGSGVLSYFTIQPTPATGTYELKRGTNLIGLRHSQNYSDIRNSVGVRRWDGTQLVNVVTLVDGDSVAAYGTRAPLSALDYPLFVQDDPALVASGVRLGAVSSPLDIFDVTAHWEAIQVEVGDFVRVTDPVEGLAQKSLFCFSSVINPDGRTVQLGLMDSEITAKAWARMDEGMTLDVGKLWW